MSLRNRLLTARSAMSVAELGAAARALQAATVHLVRGAAGTVAAYVPVGREPGGADLPQAIAGALPAGSRLLLPILLPDGDLDWARYDDPADLVAGPRGLLEPAGPRLGVSVLRDAGLVLVPALAVDHAGVRLGRGGGSYDRALARVRAGRVVALLHDGELLDRVPGEPHDQPVHAVITPGAGLLATAADGGGDSSRRPLIRGPEWTK